MKLKASVLLSTVVVSTAAFAQETAAPAAAEKAETAAPAATTAQEAAPATAKPAAAAEKSVTPYGILQGRYDLLDSQNQTSPVGYQLITRFGLKVKEGIAAGQIELQANGANVPKSKAETTGGYNGVGIRRADAGLDLASGTSFRIGRYRFGGASIWGVDATPTLDGFGSSDGLMLAQKIAISEGNEVTVKAGVASALSVTAYTSTTNESLPKTAENFVYGTKEKATDSKAILIGVDAKISGVIANVHYGMDGKAYTKPAVAAKAASGDTPAVTATPDGYQAVTHLEAAVGYELEGLSAGVSFQQTTQSETKSLKKSEGGKVTLGDSWKDGKGTQNLLVVGANGDSTLFDVKDLLQSGDKITYGLGFSSYTQTNSAAKGDAKKAIENGNFNAISLGAGYKVGGLLLELDFVTKTAKGEIYKNAKNDKTVKTANEVYVTSIYEF